MGCTSPPDILWPALVQSIAFRRPTFSWKAPLLFFFFCILHFAFCIVIMSSFQWLALVLAGVLLKLRSIMTWKYRKEKKKMDWAVSGFDSWARSCACAPVVFSLVEKLRQEGRCFHRPIPPRGAWRGFCFGAACASLRPLYKRFTFPRIRPWGAGAIMEPSALRDLSSVDTLQRRRTRLTEALGLEFVSCRL